LFERHAVHLQPGVAGGLQEHRYVHGKFGPGQCIKNALTFAVENPGTSPWWAFSLYWDDTVSGWTYWLHSFCLSADGKVLYDPTVPPRSEPAGAPRIFVGVPWCWEVFSFLATSPVNRGEALPWFLQRSLEAFPPSIPTASTVRAKCPTSH
jgi:hypothetical protein